MLLLQVYFLQTCYTTNRYDKTSPINRIKSFSLSSIVHLIIILKSIAKSCGHFQTNRPLSEETVNPV